MVGVGYGIQAFSLPQSLSPPPPHTHTLSRTIQAKEGALARALAGVEGELAPNSSAGLQRRLEAVAAAARLRGGGGGAASMGPGAGGVTKLEEKSLSQLFAVLREHADGVRHLQVRGGQQVSKGCVPCLVMVT